MKIEKTGLYLIRMNLVHPFRTSFGETKEREMLLVCLESEGEKGWGECVSETGPWYSGETISSCTHIISEFIIPWIKEKELFHPKEFKDICKSIKGNQMAKACVEDAIWDLFGRLNKRSLQKLIGKESAFSKSFVLNSVNNVWNMNILNPFSCSRFSLFNF